MTKIYDCFSYWDEDLLLDIRFNILNDYVDYFVIIEGNKTWQNNDKKLRFEIASVPLQTYGGQTYGDFANAEPCSSLTDLLRQKGRSRSQYLRF